MSLYITSSTINKLGHEIPEIRIRALKHIESKIDRYLNQNEDITFNPGSLLKQLIRWFGQKPLCEEEIVLNIVLTLLKSKFSHEAIRFLGLERVKKEFYKVDEIVKRFDAKKLLTEIFSLLSIYQTPEITSPTKTFDLDDSSLHLKSISEISYEVNSSNYEKPWSLPSAPDYNSLKLLADSIDSEGDDDSLEHAFRYLENAINDYPAEYFLQPPYIFKSLITLYDKNKSKCEILLRILTKLTKSLAGRIKMRQLSKTHYVSNEQNKLLESRIQISSSQFCIQLFRLGLECLKDLGENSNETYSILVFNLQIEIFNLMSTDVECDNSGKSFLIDLGYLARNYRQSFAIDEHPNKLKRIYYVLVLYLMIKLLEIENKNGAIASTRSNYNPDNYTVSTASNLELRDGNDVWLFEMECGLLDFPLKEMFPELHRKIKSIANRKRLEIFLDCANILEPAITILRNYDEMSDEEVVMDAGRVLDTLSIHQNLNIVTKLMRAISKCIPYYAGNSILEDTAEKLLIRLFAHENIKVRRIAYKEACDSVKCFFGAIMNGETLLNMNRSHSPRARTFGIPLSIEILNEIICFGCADSDLKISTNAEIIISLIIKAKSIMGNNWQNLLEILMPNLPLLQCLHEKKSKLSCLLLNIFNPDSDLDPNEILRGNLRFMFSDDNELRNEALSRIIYIFSIQPGASIWTPNLLEISDTIPNNICIVNAPRSVENIFAGGYYEKATVFALIELLKCPDVEPTIRKTTFMQLNVICQDPNLVELVYDENGWELALKALENSLKKDCSIDYRDTAIPAIGIIVKIALCHTQFRRDLSQDENIYFLLLRALFTYRHDIIFQQDCALTLFLLLFSPYIVGSRRIAMPKICCTLTIPIKCTFMSNSSRYGQRTALEETYLKLSLENDVEKISGSHCSLKSRSQQMNFQDCDFIFKESALQFLRFTFAKLWYFGSDRVEREKYASTLSYNVINNADENSISDLNDFLKYNTDLILRKTDIDLLKISSIEQNLKQFLQDISNANTHDDVLIGIAKIQLCCLINSNCMNQEKTSIGILKRYLITPPNNDQDILLLENAILLMIQLIESNNKEILLWLLKELKVKQNLFFNLLKSHECPIRLYKQNCKFLQIIVKKCIYYNDKDEIKPYLMLGNSDEGINFYNKLFESTIPVAEDCFRKRDIDRFRVLLNLLQFISASGRVDLDKGFAIDIIKKMLHFIMTLKSFTQAGSHINKNCLLIIANLMQDINEFILDAKHLKCLSGLCGHCDFEIRVAAWCVLEKISRSLKGAHLLVKDLSFLPGGFHACCLSTFLDMYEVPLVRASAGGLLSNLLSYTTKSGNIRTIQMSVAPFCFRLESSVSDDGLGLITQLFAKHRFYERVEESLESFYISDAILGNECTIITCDIVKMYCSIFINLSELRPALLLEYYEHPCFEKMFRIIQNVPLCITESALEMVGDICNLLLRFFQADSNLLQRFSMHEYNYITILISLLDTKLFGKIENSSLINILQVLRVLVNETSAYQLVCEILVKENNSALIYLIIDSICSNDMNLQQVSLQFLSSILRKGQTETFNFSTIHEIFESTPLNASQNSTIEIRPNSSILKNKQNASMVIFSALNTLFVNAMLSTNKSNKHSCEKIKQLKYCSETMGLLLKCSKSAQAVAKKLRLFEFLIGQLDGIFNGLGMSCTDFIRKHGDAKKEPIIDTFVISFRILLNWYNNDLLEDDKQILQITKILLNTWPWINHSSELRTIVVTLMAILSDSSLAVCKQFSTNISGYSNSIIQLVTQLATHETAKVKSSQIDIALLSIVLRIISNCCSCIEGRLQIVKLNVLAIAETFHPSITKLQKNANPVLMLWLQFWAVFSRYPEGGIVRHLGLLCTLVVKSNSEIRLLSLTIMRNMSFLITNRAALLSSNDFLYMIKMILDDGNLDEQLLITVAIWKLIAGNCKGKHLIKSTSVPRKIKILHENLMSNQKTDNNLFNVLEILIDILNT